MKYVIDIDGTICKEVGEVIGREPYMDRIEKINKLYDEGKVDDGAMMEKCLKTGIVGAKAVYYDTE